MKLEHSTILQSLIRGTSNLLCFSSVGSHQNKPQIQYKLHVTLHFFSCYLFLLLVSLRGSLVRDVDGSEVLLSVGNLSLVRLVGDEGLPRVV